MHAQCLIAEYSSLADARVGLEVLDKFDFHADAVSLVSRGDEAEMSEVGQRQRTDEEEAQQVGRSAGLGSLIGGSIATPIAIGTMVGPFLVAGPLAGLVAGAAVGGLLSPTTQWGVEKNDTRSYEKRVQEGSVLIIVTSTAHRLDEAEEGLMTTGPQSLQRFKRDEEPDQEA